MRVLKTATVADVGRAINPQLVERQDEGGTLQGLGNALYEELVYEDGLLLNETLLDYRVPGFEDVPDEMHCIIVENEDGPGPTEPRAVARERWRPSPPPWRPRSPTRAFP